MEYEYTMPQCPIQQSSHTYYHGDTNSQNLLFVMFMKNIFMQGQTALWHIFDRDIGYLLLDSAYEMY